MKILLRVDDVGRRPGDSPEHGTDKDLSHFEEWFDTLGLGKLPACYAVVPEWVSREAITRLSSKVGVDNWGVHGWDHKRKTQPSIQQMRQAREKLCGATQYVPPFNDYTGEQISDWDLVGGKLFFGAIHEQVDMFKVGGCAVVHAHNPYYARSQDILTAWRTQKRPSLSVMTLHVPWEDDKKSLRRLGDEIHEHLIGWSELHDLIDSAEEKL